MFQIQGPTFIPDKEAAKKVYSYAMALPKQGEASPINNLLAQTVNQAINSSFSDESNRNILFNGFRDCLRIDESQIKELYLEENRNGIVPAGQPIPEPYFSDKLTTRIDEGLTEIKEGDRLVNPGIGLKFLQKLTNLNWSINKLSNLCEEITTSIGLSFDQSGNIVVAS